MESKDRFTCAPSDYGIPPKQADVMANLVCAHNAFLDEASERGVIGLGLLVALLAACWWRAWKLDPWSGTAGMLGVWTVACLTQSMTVRGVAVLLLAVIVTRCAFVERDP
jgi:O-antigen ligase